MARVEEPNGLCGVEVPIVNEKLGFVEVAKVEINLCGAPNRLFRYKPDKANNPTINTGIPTPIKYLFILFSINKS